MDHLPVWDTIQHDLPKRTDIIAGSRFRFKENTRDVRNELLIVLYLDIQVGHDKNQYIPI